MAIDDVPLAAVGGWVPTWRAKVGAVEGELDAEENRRVLRVAEVGRRDSRKGTLFARSALSFGSTEMTLYLQTMHSIDI